MNALWLGGWDDQSIWGHTSDGAGGYYLALLWKNGGQPASRDPDVAINYRQRVPSPRALAEVIADRTGRPVEDVRQAMGLPQAVVQRS